MVTINRLLKKPSWTGREAGQVLLASMINDIKAIKQGKAPKPLFSQAEFNGMLGTVTSDKGIKEYAIYKELYYSLKEAYNRTIIYPQAFCNGYYRYYNVVALCYNSDRAEEAEDRHPLIVSEAQYKRLKATAEKEIRERKECFSDMVLRTLAYFLFIPKKAPREIIDAINNTSLEPVTSKRIIAIYPKDGYLTLPDGRRSDQMSSREWETAVDAIYLQHHSLVRNGRKAGLKDTRAYYNARIKERARELYFQGIEGVKAAYKAIHNKPMQELPPEQEKVLKPVLEALMAREPKVADLTINSPFRILESFIYNEILEPVKDGIEWHECEADPTLTKYDILTADALEDYFPYTEAGEARAIEAFKEFIADYSELFALVSSYVETHIPAFKGIKPAQYYKPLVTWETLTELNYLNYKADAGVTALDIGYSLEGKADYSTARKARNGIAIIQDPGRWNLTEEGDFKGKSPLSYFQSIETLRDIEGGDLEHLQENLIKASLQYIYAYNVLLDIIGNAYGIDNIEHLQVEPEPYEEMIRKLNNLIYNLYADAYGDAETRERKQALIKEYLIPIKAEELKPREKDITRVKELIDSIDLTPSAPPVLSNFDALINMLQGRE